MKILVVDYGFCNFHNLISLVEDGHEVIVISSMGWEKLPHRYYESLGIKFVPELPASRDKYFNPYCLEQKFDMIINTSPQMRHLYNRFGGEDSNVKYVGLTSHGSHLEFGKLYIRSQIEGIGVLCPDIVTEPIVPYVLKPCNVISGEFDFCMIFLDQEYSDSFHRDIDPELRFFLEEYVPDCIETNTAYCMAKGKWSIMHNQEILGEDVAKLAGQFTHWTKTSSFKMLSDEHVKLTEENAAKILDMLALQCAESSYVGQITGLISPEGDWLFCENNVRPEQTNSLPYFVSGNQFLEAMDGNPDILGDAFPKNVHKMIVNPKEPDSIYPFELHRKHGVAIPCGLDILEGEYRVSLTMRKRSGDGRIGLVICDRVIPDGFVRDMENNPNWIVTSLLRP